MTKAGLERILRVWCDRLPLDSWDVSMDWDAAPDSGSRACVWLPTDYHRARIGVTSEFGSWSDLEANQTMVHELMHVLLRDLSTVAEHSAGLLGGQAEALSYKQWRHAEEGLVEAMAFALVDTVGIA